ncbi:MAG: hypothetical protein O2894_13635 [Planctomycetota bacterium]|nr:hypothetical protein [Planctomycetota bacterium]
MLDSTSPPRSARRSAACSALALWLCLALVPTAQAKDARPVELPLTNGQSLTGVVEEGDEREVVVRLGPEQVRRVPWSRLAPLGYYRAKRALAPAADGDARLRLAELAVDLGLHVEAREEYEKALALGAIEKSHFKKAVSDAERDAVENGVRYAERLAESGDLEAAMEIARRLKLDFATAPNAGEINKLVEKLIKLVQSLDREASKEQAELEAAIVAGKREKEILERKTRALDLVLNAEKRLPEWQTLRDRGSLTKARRIAEAVDEMFQEARLNLGRLRRILPRDHEARREILAQLTKLDKSQFDLRLAMAQYEKEATAWKHAERWAARASYIDPVHPDLVELRDYLMTNRIQYRLSDVTNARGRVSGP